MPKNPNIKLGWPYPARKKLLDDLSMSQQVKYTYRLKFQGTTNTFPVYSVEIDLPKYRLANGRTQAAQEMYLAKHSDLPPDFFTKDMESEQALNIQHGLLWELVENTRLLSYFKDISNSQDQPLIITANGFVVNGNRRLCAMRELYYGDREKFNQFGHVDVLILPVCSEKDIDELEAYIQLQPDIKEDYSWIAKACMLRARQERYHYTNDQLAKLYDISEKEVQATLMQLALVDDYLGSRGKSKQYDSVEKDEFAFRQLLKGRQQIKQAIEKDILTEVGYCLIESEGEVEGRLYDRIPEVKDNLPQIEEGLLKELQPVIPQQQLNNDDHDLLGRSPEKNRYEPLIAVIGKPEYRTRVIDTVIDVIDRQKEKDRQNKRENAVFLQITEANTHLRNAINYINEGTAKQGIEEQLQVIDNSISEIRKWLNEDA